jgi:hypothetical protein
MSVKTVQVVAGFRNLDELRNAIFRVSEFKHCGGSWTQATAAQCRAGDGRAVAQTRTKSMACTLLRTKMP